MTDLHRIAVRVNGQDEELEVEARRTLADVLREDLGLTGTHLACEHGVCGACTVRVDGRAARSCLMLAVQADGTDVETVEAVVRRLTELAGPEEPPARLHGDLWSGNIVWGAEHGTLIDPAAHGGHRETDLAMLSLFGVPHLQRLLDAYQDETPLADGWEERQPVHQLFPLLVHAALFGGHYGLKASEAAQRALQAG